jgi:hypothetical protein
MGNQFHLVVEALNGNLIAGMRWFLAALRGATAGERGGQGGVVVQEELHKLRWTEDHLARRRKGDRGTVPIARRLRQETTMTWPWIAQRLLMGVWTHVSNLLRAD